MSDNDTQTPGDITPEPPDEQVINDSTSIAEQAFVGDHPLITIIDGTRQQFSNYMSQDADQTNYLEIFYDQLAHSYQVLEERHDLVRSQDMKESLATTYDQFVDLLGTLISEYLGIGIVDLEEGTMSPSDSTYVLTRIYEYFILQARRNFKVAIATSVNAAIRLNRSINSDNYFEHLQELLEDYSPLITNIMPMDFLNFTGDRELIELYANGRIGGNFLLRYSPKLYQNQDFVVELINYITAHQNLGSDFDSRFKDTAPDVQEPMTDQPPELADEGDNENG